MQSPSGMEEADAMVLRPPIGAGTEIDLADGLTERFAMAQESRTALIVVVTPVQAAFIVPVKTSISPTGSTATIAG